MPDYLFVTLTLIASHIIDLLSNISRDLFTILK